MICSSILFSLMGVSTKLAAIHVAGAPPLPAEEIAVVRFGFGVLFLVMYGWLARVKLLGNDRSGLLLRGISGGIASTAYFVGIQATSLTHATLLNSTNVIWASLFAIWTLGERLRISGFLAVLGALAGVILVTNPAAGHLNAGDAISLFSGIAAGTAVVQVRRLRRSESSASVFFYFNLVGLPIALACGLASHSHFVAPAGVEWPVLLAVGITSVGGQILMTYGYKELPAAQGSLLILTSVALSALLSHIIFHDPIGARSLVGGVLIVLAAVALSISPAVHTPPGPKNGES